MVSIAGTYDEHAAPADDFSPIPAGEYRAYIEEADVEEISRRGDKGRCLKITWKVDGGDYNGRLVWQRISMWAENMNNLDKVIQIANSSFAQIRDAVGKPIVNDTDELVGLSATIRVNVKIDPNGQYSPQNEVKAVKHSGNAPVQQNRAPVARQSPGRAAPPQGRQAPAAQSRPGGGGGNALPFGARRQPAAAAAGMDDEIPF